MKRFLKQSIIVFNLLPLGSWDSLISLWECGRPVKISDTMRIAERSAIGLDKQDPSQVTQLMFCHRDRNIYITITVIKLLLNVY